MTIKIMISYKLTNLSKKMYPGILYISQGKAMPIMFTGHEFDVWHGKILTLNVFKDLHKNIQN